MKWPCGFRKSPPTRVAEEQIPDQSSGEWKELKELLFSEERAQLGRIERHMARWPNSQEVARALPDAIAIANSRGNSFKQAIAPAVTEALQVTVRKDPQPLVDVIFPLLGPVIRKAIQSALEGMVQSLNQATEHGMNLSWRFGAWRARMPFGQYVLLKTLIYRVEHVYLIHNQTSLPLCLAEDKTMPAADADMVSGMLTAVSDFVKDSFQTGEALDQVKMGNHQLLVQRGLHASLALLVRGTPPASLLEQATEVLEGIHFRHAEDFDTFSGDDQPFQSSVTELEGLLSWENTPVSPLPSRRLRILAMSGLGLLTLLGGFGGLREYRWRRYLEELEKIPGILLTRTEVAWLGQGWRDVYGLRDELAANPEPLASEFGFEGSLRYHWEPFHSLDDLIVRRRMVQILRPPSTAHLELKDGILTSTGRASQDWMMRARVLAVAFPGVQRYVDKDLEDIEPMGRLRKLLNPPETIRLLLEGRTLMANGSAPYAWIKQARQLTQGHPDLDDYDDGGVENLDMAAITRLRESLGEVSIYFQPGTTQVLGSADSALERVAKDWKRLQSQAKVVERQYTLQVTGQSDATGVAKQNEVLSKQRAAAMLAQLVQRGIPEADMTVAASQSNREDPRMRRVIFLVQER